MSSPPKHVDVLVIGGGPGGSYAAAALAREGVDVALFESTKFPRYHIGESLIPSVRHYMNFIGAEEKLMEHGFHRKPGSAIKFNQYKREGYTDFIALGCNNNAWNVIRSEFDHLLLSHAQSTGVQVYQLTKVTSISFSENGRPISASWVHSPMTGPPSPPTMPVIPSVEALPSTSPTEIIGTTTFNHVIDASGRAGILSTRYLKNRHFNISLKNIAVWGYWKDTEKYGIGTPREGAPWFEALTDESGWAWFIPLHNNTVSVGLVMDQSCYNDKKKNFKFASPFNLNATPNPDRSVTMARYISDLSLAPGVVKLISKNGQLQDNVRMASDFSYSATSHAGPGYRIIGDAGAFIDPFFSSGIHLAMTSALSAAATICASLRRDCTEQEAADWHTNRVANSYTRFQVVVLSAYKQMKSQTTPVLSDIDEDNFDRAFSFLRPIIQGASEMGARLSEKEVQDSLDFCMQLFNPTTPEQQQEMVGKIPDRLLSVTAPIVHPSLLEDLTNSLSKEALDEKMVLDKINARRLIQAEYEINNLELEYLEGRAIRLQRGNLGLITVPY